MVSKVVGTCIPKNLDMGMCLLGRVTRCWKMRVADCRFRVEMENMAEAVGKTDWKGHSWETGIGSPNTPVGL